MIVDLSESPRAELPDYDLCIVGTGPAGTTVARELAGSGLRVGVLESGRLRVTKHGDALRKVESEGIAIKEYSRERVLGGASTTWAGLSSLMDEVDFEPRPFLRHSGWPIEREALLPWYAAAAERYRFPPRDFFGARGFGALRAGGDLQPRWERVDEKVFLAADPPQDFGREHRAVYEREDVDLWLDATVVRLETDPGTRRVAAAVARTSAGAELRVRARAFVVATGGIENARLLLASRDLCADGLGNERHQVGRYLMNHPKNYHGVLRLGNPVTELPYYFGCLYEGFAGYAGLRLPQALQRERGLLNSYVRLEPLFPWSDNMGVESLVLIVKRSAFVLRAWKAGKRGKAVSLRDYSETGDDSDFQNQRKTPLQWLGVGANVVLHLPSVLQYLWFRLSKAKPRVRRVRLRNFMEMEPDPDNRVTLGAGRDANGEPVAHVAHRCTELDRRSLVELHAVLGREVEATGLGTLRTTLADEPAWPITQDASHHMGTTRMGTDPATSVCDPDCRVHGVDNLWMAGASVFPTSGCANPTFTLVALAIRLADHLKRALPAGAEAR